MDSRCQLNLRQVRLIYLITYSQADSSIAATREDFARIVVDAFSKTNTKWFFRDEPVGLW